MFLTTPYKTMTQGNTIDTTGAISTATSIGSAIVGEAIGPHPLQLVAWGVAILSGLVAITLGCIRIRNAWIQPYNDDR